MSKILILHHSEKTCKYIIYCLWLLKSHRPAGNLKYSTCITIFFYSIIDKTSTFFTQLLYAITWNTYHLHPITIHVTLLFATIHHFISTKLFIIISTFILTFLSSLSFPSHQLVFLFKTQLSRM